MAESGLSPFVLFFPEQAQAEIRVISIGGYPGLPDDDYGLQDSYCVDPACHCRRVMLNVVNRSRGETLASISYGFDRDDEMAGPFLDPLNPQSRYAEALLALVAGQLDDPAYVARLRAHYYQVKGSVSDPDFRRPPLLVRRVTTSSPTPPRGPRTTHRKRKRR